MRRLFKPGTRISKTFRGPILNIFQKYIELKNHIKWIIDEYPIPASSVIKRKILSKYSCIDSTWIETGTYHGDTTNYLSRKYPQVISIEPSKPLHDRAVDRFWNKNNIKLIYGASEDVFLEICQSVRGNVAFWLDGLVSEAGTYRGVNSTPLLLELEFIEKNLKNYSNVSIFIDDTRLMNNSLYEQEGYPALDEILSFSTRNKMHYSIQNDIIIIIK